ncbi:hypothetical protein BASA82_000588 [Batrachochytrium salamandrivorans]|nr:hypothetical protein BASA82_000588 [Batrachochytrium salamandrivorans]
MGAAFSLCSMASTAFVSSFGLLFQGLSCAFTAAAAFSCLFNTNGISAQAANLFNVLLFGLAMLLAIILRLTVTV